MTLNEYLTRISSEIAHCCDEDEAVAVLDKAQRVLDKSNISNESQKKFWIDLYKEVDSFSWVMEGQDSKSLSAIIDKVKIALARKAER